MQRDIVTDVKRLRTLLCCLEPPYFAYDAISRSGSLVDKNDGDISAVVVAQG